MLMNPYFNWNTETFYDNQKCVKIFFKFNMNMNINIAIALHFPHWVTC